MSTRPPKADDVSDVEWNEDDDGSDAECDDEVRLDPLDDSEDEGAYSVTDTETGVKQYFTPRQYFARSGMDYDEFRNKVNSWSIWQRLGKSYEEFLKAEPWKLKDPKRPKREIIDLTKDEDEEPDHKKPKKS